MSLVKELEARRAGIFIVLMSDIAQIHTPVAISVMHMYAESFPIQQVGL